jgi:hypothetical protein
MILSRNGASVDDPAHKFYVMTTTGSTSSGVPNGYYIKNPLGVVVDAIATDSYTFSAGSGVTALDWSGSIAYSGGFAGAIRTISDNNTASDWSLASISDPQTIGSLNPTLSAGGSGSGCVSARVADTVFVILFPYEAWLVGVTAPVDACSNGPEHVTIRVRNDGSNTINNFIAKYSINGSALVSETVTQPIISGDTLTFTFANTFNPALTSANPDSIYNIQVYIELAGDPVQSNDTLFKQVELFYTPPVPAVTNVTIPYATTATLNAVSADSICWFDVPSGGVALSNSSTFTTPVLYNTSVFYASAVASGGSKSWTFDTGLDGWSVQTPCTTTSNWVWDSDAGAGALFAEDPSVSTSQSSRCKSDI